MVECCLVGCKSVSKKNQKKQFFKFPDLKNPLYNKWIKQCHESVCVIKVHPEPYVCSEHFDLSDSGKITENSIPTLKLNPCTYAKIAHGEQTQIKEHFMNLIKETLLEWCMRAQHYPKIAPECKNRSALTALACQLLNMLKPEVDISFNNDWWDNFETVLTARLQTYSSNNSWNKSLVLENILQQLNPMINLHRAENIVSNNGIELNVDQHLRPSQDNEQSSRPVTNTKSEGKEATKHSGEDICCQPNVKSEFVIDSYSDALEYIKTLQDFALEQDDYRAIGMLSGLKDILQSRKNED